MHTNTKVQLRFSTSCTTASDYHKRLYKAETKDVSYIRDTLALKIVSVKAMALL